MSDIYLHDLVRPDGAALTLYSQRPIDVADITPRPFPALWSANPHLRWHPLRGEWVAYAVDLRDSSVPASPETSPLAAVLTTTDPAELPGGQYDMAVFAGHVPALALNGDDLPRLTVPTARVAGYCELVVFARDANASLATLDLSRIALLLSVWADRRTRLAQHAGIKYMLPFENRSVDPGSPSVHSHCHIAAYPFVPPLPRRMLEQEQEFYAQHGRALLVDLAQREADSDGRVLYLGAHAIAFVPPCARYPYEVWVTPRTQVSDLRGLAGDQRADLARALKTVLRKYDGLWQRSLPYLMAWYQAPLDGRLHPETQLHAQLMPRWHTRERLPCLAGAELAAGVCAMEVLPEQNAAALRQVAVEVEEA